MTVVAMLARDLAALGATTLQALAEGDWQAVDRLEMIRLGLLRQLAALAQEESQRLEVLEALYAAQAMGAQLSAAIDGQRRAEHMAAAHADRAIRAGQAYAAVRTV